MSNYSPASTQSLTASAELYYKKWVDVGTGGRVVYDGYSVMLNAYLFRCTQCKEKFDLTPDSHHTTFVPFYLQDWVKLHRHVCSSYNAALGNGQPAPCAACGWPEGEHPKTESFITIDPATIPPYAMAELVFTPQYNVKHTLTLEEIVEKCVQKKFDEMEAERKKNSPRATDVEGRKFR